MTEEKCEIEELNLKLDEIDDPRRSYALVQERIRSYRTQGRQVPDALSRIERRLASECRLESQGR